MADGGVAAAHQHRLPARKRAASFWPTWITGSACSAASTGSSSRCSASPPVSAARFSASTVTACASSKLATRVRRSAMTCPWQPSSRPMSRASART